jgi:hypothetical protein
MAPVDAVDKKDFAVRVVDAKWSDLAVGSRPVPGPCALQVGELDDDQIADPLPLENLGSGAVDQEASVKRLAGSCSDPESIAGATAIMIPKIAVLGVGSAATGASRRDGPGRRPTRSSVASMRLRYSTIGGPICRSRM